MSDEGSVHQGVRALERARQASHEQAAVGDDFSRVLGALDAAMDRFARGALQPGPLPRATDATGRLCLAETQFAEFAREVESLRERLFAEGRLAEEWEGRARRAVEAGDEAQARQALAMQASHLGEVACLRPELLRLEAAMDAYRSTLAELHQRVAGEAE